MTYRIDLEKKLKDILVKYDCEIGERSDDLKELKNKLDQESATLAIWKEKYEKQEILYNEIQADKEAEELKNREEKILLFLMNRAARTIQRYYRHQMEQRKTKKKGRGKKSTKEKKP